MGQVRLVSDIWDFLPRVEIREGRNLDPSQNPIKFTGPVQRGQTFLSADGVTQCYRRSANPSDPGSPLSEFRCNANPTSGVDDWSLS
jgi:hypothetical protein